MDIPVTIPEYGQCYTLDEDLTMEQAVEPVTQVTIEKSDVLDKIKTLKEELDDMEVIVKEEYLGEQADDDSISRLKLRLKEIEEQIVRIVEKN